MTHPHCGLPAASTPQLPQAMYVCVCVCLPICLRFPPMFETKPHTMWVSLFLRRRPVARVLQGSPNLESRDPPFWWVPFKIDKPPARLLPWPCSPRPNARFLRILQGAGGCQRGGASVAAVRLPHQRANQRQPAGAVGMLRHRRPFWVRVLFLGRRATKMGFAVPEQKRPKRVPPKETDPFATSFGESRQG